MQLNHIVIGEGKPLVILHGLFGSLDNWLTIGRSLAKEYKIYLVDQRNHGRSFHSNEWKYADMAEDLFNLVTYSHEGKINIIGHSMGGKTAMKFAELYPERVEKLVVVDIGPKYYSPHHHQILTGLNSIDPEKISSRLEADEIMSRAIEDPGIRMFLLKNLVRSSDNKFKWRINLPIMSRYIENIGEEIVEEGKINHKTLFISGGRSDYILEEDKEIIKKKFPNSMILKIKNAGHWIHAEKPEELKESVKSFINFE